MAELPSLSSEGDDTTSITTPIKTEEREGANISDLIREQMDDDANPIEGDKSTSRDVTDKDIVISEIADDERVEATLRD